MIVRVEGACRTGILGLCVLSACSFESGLSATSAMLEDSDTSTSAASSAASDDATTAGVTSDMSGSHSGTESSNSGEVGSESDGVDETTTSIDPSEGNPPRADLVFVQMGPVELGVHALEGPTVLTLQLTNQGEADASVLAGEVPPSPLAWAGDVFPGTDATCQGLISPGSTCTVTLVLGPGQPGLASGSVALRFGDDVGEGTASIPVELTATGTGQNLIVNPDAESDPEGAILTGWDAEDSTFHTTTGENHGTGSLSFFGGGSENPSITQDLVVAPWSESIDGLGLRFAFTGWTRANNDVTNDDPHGISITFLDGTGAPLDGRSRTGMTHDDWESTNFDAPIPAQTRRIRIALTCDRNDWLIGNSNCSAWFDDFAGSLVYTPR